MAPASPTCTPPGRPAARPSQALRALPGGGGRDGTGGREVARGLSPHSSLRITGLCFLWGQNNYNLHRGFLKAAPGVSGTTSFGSQSTFSFRVGKEKSQRLRETLKDPVSKGRMGRTHKERGSPRPQPRQARQLRQQGSGRLSWRGLRVLGEMSTVGREGHSGPRCCRDLSLMGIASRQGGTSSAACPSITAHPQRAPARGPQTPP